MLKPRNQQFIINGVKTLSFSLLHKHHLSTTTSSSSSSSSIESLSTYLVNSLGFSKQQSLITSTKLAHQRLAQGAVNSIDLKVAQNAVHVVDFLQSNGFNRSQIRNIVNRVPRVLLCRVEKTLKPKFQFFDQLGFSRDYLLQVIAVNSGLLVKSLDSNIMPAIRAFRRALGNDVDVLSFFMKASLHRILPCVVSNLEPNVALMRKYGVSDHVIRKHVCRQPSAFVRKPELMEEVFVRVEEELGIPSSSGMFMYGVQLLTSFSEKTIGDKFKLFESFGWEKSDVSALIRRFPCCFWCSETRVRNYLGFYMKELGYEPKILVERPCLLTYSLDKRVKPRYKILLVMKEKGLIREDYPLYLAVSYTEAAFVKKFVVKFKEIHQVYTKYTGLPLRLPNAKLEEKTKSLSKMV